MARDFEGKVIAITGAGKGLGRAYAFHLAGLGGRIVVNNRRHAGDEASSADRVVERIRELGGIAVSEYSSVEDPDSGELLLETALQNFGRLDAVVANAGVSEGLSFHKQDLAGIKKVIDINLMGTVNILHPVFRYLYEQRRGSLVVSTSAAGLYGEHGLPAYSASKAAVLGLMYALSKEGASHGLRVNAVAPFATTQMTERDLPEALKERLPPEKVAPVVAWLVSEQCPLNGEILITAAGRVSRAGMMETKALELAGAPAYDPAGNDRLWRQLQAQPLERKYSGAQEQFNAFVGN